MRLCTPSWAMMDGPAAKRARVLVDELRKETSREGEEVIHELPALARDLQANIQRLFCFSTLDEVETEYAEHCSLALLEEAHECPRTRELTLFVRGEVDRACRRFTALETWLKLKTPKIEDGNNFGVDVQKQFLSVVQDYRNYAWKETCALKNHRWNRAVISESLEKAVTEESSEWREAPVSPYEAPQDAGAKPDAGGSLDVRLRGPAAAGADSAGIAAAAAEASLGPLTKSSRMVRRSTNKMPHIAHYRRYVQDLEVESYFKMRHTARNLMQYYLDVYDMFEKNWEKILFPRGQNSSGGLMY